MNWVYQSHCLHNLIRTLFPTCETSWRQLTEYITEFIMLLNYPYLSVRRPSSRRGKKTFLSVSLFHGEGNVFLFFRIKTKKRYTEFRTRQKGSWTFQRVVKKALLQIAYMDLLFSFIVWKFSQGQRFHWATGGGYTGPRAASTAPPLPEEPRAATGTGFSTPSPSPRR